MGNQRYMRYERKGDKEELASVCYQYRCGLDTGVSFIHAKRAKDAITYFCINYPSGARERFEAIVKQQDRREVLRRHFFLDTLAADDSLKQWQFDIGRKRVDLFRVEKTLERPLQVNGNSKSEEEKSPTDKSSTDKLAKKERYKDLLELLSYGLYSRKKERDEEKPATHKEKRHDSPSRDNHEERSEKSPEHNVDRKKDDFDSATHELHDMVRHWLGLKQDCGDLLAQLKFLHETYKIVREKRGSDWPIDLNSDAGESFEVLMSQCDICVRWTEVYYERIQTRIGLLFHLANQRTAADTARIAEQTQRDSASMITIAAVTLVFLPGTFVCTIVSTNLFDFGEEGLQASRQWYILLAVALPLTIIVVAVWDRWWRWRLMNHERKEKQTASDMQTYGVSMSRRSTGFPEVHAGARHGSNPTAGPPNGPHQAPGQQHSINAH
ncbi:hypothetical protein E8E11_004446 [Didymella keratinophila]|nr:hypothetical protein E8E11_004446 [Didymella keratinophila]